MLFNIFLLVTGLFVLILGGDFLVRGASRIALRFHISPLVIGLTVVAFGTSSPELLVSLKSADRAGRNAGLTDRPNRRPRRQA